jgi:N utilization substance protein A
MKTFKNTEILYVIDTIAREKSISADELFNALEGVIEATAKMQYGASENISVRLDRKSGNIELYRILRVVTDEEYESIEDRTGLIPLTLAQKVRVNIVPGEAIEEALPQLDMSRMSAYVAKKLIVEKLKEIEIERHYNQLQGKVGEIVQGMIRSIDRRGATVMIDGVEGYIPRSQMIKSDNFKVGDRMKAYLVKIEKGLYEVIMTLSRTCGEFLGKLMRNEVPEMQDDLIEIKAIVRDPGSKSKVVVYSPDRTIDSVGSCVGVKGSRIQAVISELGGERIDVIRWSPELSQYITNCFHPIQLLRIVVDEEHHSIDIEVMDKDLSPVIGRQGQNIKLTSRLLDMSINVNPERNVVETNNEDEVLHKLMDALDIDDLLAHLLISEGYKTPQEMIKAGEIKIAKIDGLDEVIANELLLRAQEYIEQSDEGEQDDAEKFDKPIASASPQPKQREVKHEENEVTFVINEIRNALQHGGINSLQAIAEMSTDELQELLEDSNVFIQREKLEMVIMNLREKLFFNLTN